MPLIATLVSATALALLPLPAAAAPSPAPAPPPVVSTVAEFDPAAGEFPESVVYRDGSAYTTLTLTGRVTRIDLPDGTRSVHAQLPVAPGNFTLGLDFDRSGNLFVAVGAGDPTDTAQLAATGVYRIPAGGGTPRRWAWGTGTFDYPSGLAFDRRGVLYVSDARAGSIFRIGPEGAPGTATPWISGPALTPDTAVCDSTSPFVLGVNGLVADHDAVWAANTIQGTVLRIPVTRSGAAGPVDTVAADCATLQGVDGLHRDPRDPRGGFLAANNFLDSVVAVSRRGQVSVVAAGSPPFATPVDLAPVTGTRPATVLVVNGAFRELFAGLPARPSLVELVLPPLRPERHVPHRRSHGR